MEKNNYTFTIDNLLDGKTIHTNNGDEMVKLRDTLRDCVITINKSGDKARWQEGRLVATNRETKESKSIVETRKILTEKFKIKR